MSEGAARDQQTPPDQQAAPDQQATAEDAELEQRIIVALRTVYDPEIPINIYDLGLIYSIAIGDAAQVHVEMTLTSPFCPVAGSLPAEVEQTVARVEGVAGAQVELVWEPPWGPDRMRPEHRIMLGL